MERAAHRIVTLALLCFVLAASTGAGLRFSMIDGLPWGLVFGNVRHAHSHLMYFGWVTPALVALIGVTLARQHIVLRGGTAIASTLLALGLSAYVPFLLSGYHLLPIGSAHLPLSMMAAGFNGIAWCVFVGLYLRSTAGRPRPLTLRYFDAAAGFLLLAALGAFALGGGAVAKVLTPAWTTALAAFFLEVFSDGWFTPALLGILYATRPALASARPPRIGLVLLVVGLAVRSLSRLALASQAGWLVWPMGLGCLLAGVGLIVCVLPILRSRRIGLLALPLGFLLVKGVVELGLAVPALSARVDAAGLHILFLHAFLLGAIALGLVVTACGTWPSSPVLRWPWLFGAAVVGVLAGLVPLTALWPRSLAGPWTLHVAAWTSLLPVAAAVFGLSMRDVSGSEAGRSHQDVVSSTTHAS